MRRTPAVVITGDTLVADLDPKRPEAAMIAVYAAKEGIAMEVVPSASGHTISVPVVEMLALIERLYERAERRANPYPAADLTTTKER